MAQDSGERRVLVVGSRCFTDRCRAAFGERIAPSAIHADYSGLDATARLVRSRYSFIVVQDGMPNRLSGYDTVVKIRNLGINVPAVIVSGSDISQAAMNIGAHYLPEDFRNSHLLAYAAHHLGFEPPGRVAIASGHTEFVRTWRPVITEYTSCQDTFAVPNARRLEFEASVPGLSLAVVDARLRGLTVSGDLVHPVDEIVWGNGIPVVFFYDGTSGGASRMGDAASRSGASLVGLPLSDYEGGFASLEHALVNFAKMR